MTYKETNMKKFIILSILVMFYSKTGHTAASDPCGCPGFDGMTGEQQYACFKRNRTETCWDRLPEEIKIKKELEYLGTSRERWTSFALKKCDFNENHEIPYSNDPNYHNPSDCLNELVDTYKINQMGTRGTEIIRILHSVLPWTDTICNAVGEVEPTGNDQCIVEIKCEGKTENLHAICPIDPNGDCPSSFSCIEETGVYEAADPPVVNNPPTSSEGVSPRQMGLTFEEML